MRNIAASLVFSLVMCFCSLTPTWGFDEFDFLTSSSERPDAKVLSDYFVSFKEGNMDISDATKTTEGFSIDLEGLTSLLDSASLTFHSGKNEPSDALGERDYVVVDWNDNKVLLFTGKDATHAPAVCVALPNSSPLSYTVLDCLDIVSTPILNKALLIFTRLLAPELFASAALPDSTHDLSVNDQQSEQPNGEHEQLNVLVLNGDNPVANMQATEPTFPIVPNTPTQAALLPDESVPASTMASSADAPHYGDPFGYFFLNGQPGSRSSPLNGAVVVDLTGNFEQTVDTDIDKGVPVPGRSGTPVETVAQITPIATLEIIGEQEDPVPASFYMNAIGNNRPSAAALFRYPHISHDDNSAFMIQSSRPLRTAIQIV